MLTGNSACRRLLAAPFCLKLAATTSEPGIRLIGRHLFAIAVYGATWRQRPARFSLASTPRRNQRSRIRHCRHGGNGRRRHGRRHDSRHHDFRNDPRLRFVMPASLRLRSALASGACCRPKHLHDQACRARALHSEACTPICFWSVAPPMSWSLTFVIAPANSGFDGFRPPAWEQRWHEARGRNPRQSHRAFFF